jgi:hypothetical protein
VATTQQGAVVDKVDLNIVTASLLALTGCVPIGQGRILVVGLGWVQTGSPTNTTATATQVKALGLTTTARGVSVGWSSTTTILVHSNDVTLTLPGRKSK